MKKILTTGIIAVILAVLSLTTLNAKSVYTDDYQLHTAVYDTSIDITNAKMIEVYFGPKAKYFEIVEESGALSGAVIGAIAGGSSQTANLAKGALETAGKGIGVGLIAGAAINYFLDYRDDLKRAKEWMYVVEFTNSKGETTRASAILTSQTDGFKKNPKIEKIKEIMKKGF